MSKMLHETVRAKLLSYLTLNEVMDGNCGTHNIKQYMFEDDSSFDPLGHIDAGDGEVITDPIDPNLDCVLTFSKGGSNSKLEWPHFSLPAGFTCPEATTCKTFAAEPGPNGKKFSDGSSLLQGKEAEFRCYAARSQSQYPPVYKSSHRNLDLLMGAKKEGGMGAMKDLLVRSIEYHGLASRKLVRVHEGGDFFVNSYFLAWMEAAKEFPNILFYAYTTSLNFWLPNRGAVPPNFKLIASMDKKNAQTILDNDLRYSVVVYSVEKAKELGLKIDVDDTIAWDSDENFALLLHGGQPKGSEAAAARTKNTRGGVYDRIKQAYQDNRGKKLDRVSSL